MFLGRACDPFEKYADAMNCFLLGDTVTVYETSPIG